MTAGDFLLRLSALTLGLSLITPSALGQGMVAQPADASDETPGSNSEGNSYSLSGTVINSITGEPIRRAAVQISGQNASVELTDASGHFAMQGLVEGSVFVNAAKPGYNEAEASHVLARVGKDSPNIVLKLTPWGVISGRVATREARPLEGLEVRVVTEQNVEGRLIWADQQNRTRTNEDGEFRIVGLQPGMYYVAVEQGSETSLSQKGVPNAREQTFAKVFYPGVSDLRAASAIEVAAGREVEANFTMTAEPVYQVLGTVTGEAVSSIGGVTFARKAGEDSDFTQTADLQGGKFQVTLPAGQYSVNGDTREGVELTTHGATVMIRADETDLQVPLSAAATIAVQVEKEQGAGGFARRVPMEGVRGVFLQLEPVSSFRRGTYSWQGQPGGIVNLEPGAYRVKVNTAGALWVKLAQSGGVDLLNNDLTIVEGGQPPPIELTLRDDGGMVVGTVTPAREPDDAIVVLVQPGTNFVRITGTMQGNFSIPGVPPGEYELFAVEAGDRVDYTNPDVWSPYLANAQHISVPAHGRINLSLTVTPRR